MADVPPGGALPSARWVMTPLTADKVITRSPAECGGLIVLASADGGDVTLYDGKDATSGRKLGLFKGGKDVSMPLVFGGPVYCGSGIFADVGASITEVQVIWRPLAPATEKAQAASVAAP